VHSDALGQIQLTVQLNLREILIRMTPIFAPGKPAMPIGLYTFSALPSACNACILRNQQFFSHSELNLSGADMSDLLILGKSDISKITVPASLVIDLVEKAVAGIGLGTSTNPPKVSIAPVEKSMTVAMLAHVKDNRALGMKAYTEFPIGAGKTKVGSVITLFDDTSGRPIAFMDCEWITAIRTAAVTGSSARRFGRRRGLCCR
jgi:Ornithine cyclodeaminase/mu-crystallin family